MLPARIFQGGCMDNRNQSTPLNDLMKIVLSDNSHSYAEKKRLLRELRKNNAGIDDRWTYRVAIYALGIAVVFSVSFIFALSWYGISPPQGLVAIGSAVTGGIAGLLSPFQHGN